MSCHVKKTAKNIFVIILLTALGLSSANAYEPGKDITVLQGFKPGGGSDTLAQLIQPYLAKELDVTFVNRYLPGAVGAIAWTKLAKQTKSDGKTISITNTPMLMTNYIINPAIKYNIEEITPIANIVTDPGIIIVKEDSPYKTAQDLFDAAKAKPGKLVLATSGIGGDDFFAALLIEKEKGLKFRTVQFQGDGPSWAAVLAGKVDAGFNNLGTTYSQLKAGHLRALAVFSDKRLEQLPDVPTLAELGTPLVSGSSRGYSAPADIPEVAKKELIAAFDKVMANPKFIEDANNRALLLDYKPGKHYYDYLKSGETTFKQIWADYKKAHPDK